MPPLERQQTVLTILQNLHDLDGLKSLFWAELNYQRQNKPLGIRDWPVPARKALAENPVLFASGGEDDAFHVIYGRLDSDTLSRGLERLVVTQLLAEHPYALFVFSNKDCSRWHFLNVKHDANAAKRRFFRRITVEPGIGLRTAAERLQMLDLASIGAELFGIPALTIQSRHDDAFDVEKVTKDFYGEIANWYFWALKHVEFPKDAPKENDGRDHISVIRLITRLVFCWFIREKGLIPDDLFDAGKLSEMLEGFAPDKIKNTESVYYRAILQNLFFATLNTEMDKRGWRREGQNLMAHSLYRHKECFRDAKAGLEWFRNIPFLNGGLFECLDRDFGENAKPHYLRIDGFSDRPDSRPTVPDFLFFGVEQEVDLSGDYGEKKFRKVRVRGLIDTLSRYKFTIEENTPFDQEVALDPELCGKVFENLLAAYNPETGTTARKATGSFYTPREIVDYMVDEALVAYLKGKLTSDDGERAEKKLRSLLSYDGEQAGFTDIEAETLIDAIDNLKALDPAVGSGAFPMGILHKLVHVLGKLDPDNEKWKAKQIAKLDDAVMREEAERVFRENYDNYGRKLYLIENCIYGVDIQPIAVQIAKMRFFISLIVDQKINPAAPNLGVRALPNLETKFVAANTLIGIEKKEKQGDFLTEDTTAHQKLKILRERLTDVRHRHFTARTPTSKTKCRELDSEIRGQMSVLLEKAGLSAAWSHQLAAWDPYDQNASSPFFDPEWMFSVREGFDIVIGNPPYGFRKIHTDSTKAYFRSHYVVAHGSYEHHFLFYEASLKMLATGGVLNFIAPVTWLTIPSAQALRKFVLTAYAVREIACFSGEVFTHASVNTAITLIQHSERSFSRMKIFPDELALPSTPLSDRNVLQQTFIDGGCYFAIYSTMGENAIIEKIRNNAQLLAEFSHPCSGYNPYEVGAGIAPGGGTHTHETVKEKPYHAATKRGKDWKPEIVGRDLQRYHVNITGKRWVHYGSWLAAPRDPQNFRGKRILVQEITGGEKRRIVAAFHDGELYHSRDVIPIRVLRQFPHPFYLLGVINSWLISWYHQKCNPKAQKGLFPKVLVSDLAKLPIACPSNEDHACIVDIVARILSAKQADPKADVTVQEREIDQIVYKLYGLTAEETRVVEGGA